MDRFCLVNADGIVRTVGHLVQGNCAQQYSRCIVPSLRSNWLVLGLEFAGDIESDGRRWYVVFDL
jgi:hypothetical protein